MKMRKEQKRKLCYKLEVKSVSLTCSGRQRNSPKESCFLALDLLPLGKAYNKSSSFTIVG